MSPLPGLSPREDQIARAYTGGETYREIAQTLGIAPSTVRTHLATIYRKLKVSSKVELLTRLQGDQPTPNPSDPSEVISELALSLEEAISREKALSEVLRIISTSRGDVKRVMPAILDYALDLCDAEFGVLFEYDRNDCFQASFARGIPAPFQTWLDDQGAFRANPETGLGRMLDRLDVINIIDVKSEALYSSDDPLRYATADLGGARSFVAIPILTAYGLAGAFTIYRQTVRPFSEEATRLAQIFADQSAIALENARLIGAARHIGP